MRMACSCNSACMTKRCPCKANGRFCGSYCSCGHSNRACQNKAQVDRCTCEGACKTTKCFCKANGRFCTTYCNCGTSRNGCQNSGVSPSGLQMGAKNTVQVCSCRSACMTVGCPCKSSGRFCGSSCNCGTSPKGCQNKTQPLLPTFGYPTGLSTRAQEPWPVCGPTFIPRTRSGPFSSPALQPFSIQFQGFPKQGTEPLPNPSTKPLQHKVDIKQEAKTFSHQRQNEEDLDKSWVIIDHQHPISKPASRRTQDSGAAVSHLLEPGSQTKPTAPFTPHSGTGTSAKKYSAKEPQKNIVPDVSSQLWKNYGRLYHELWNQLEKHPEALQDDRVIRSVRDIMEGSPIVDFGCIQDLILTMKEMVGEGLFKHQEKELHSFLQSKAVEAVHAQQAAICTSHDLGVEIKQLYRFQMKSVVPSDHEDIEGEILQIADNLKEIRASFVQNPKLQESIRGQDLVRQQGLVVDYNIMTTLYLNLYIRLCQYANPQEAAKVAGETLTILVDEAVKRNHNCMRSVQKFFSRISVDQQPRLRRQIKWPVQIPILSCSYDSRKHEVITHLANQVMQCPTVDQHRVVLPPIYIPVSTDGGANYVFVQYFQEKVQAIISENEMPAHIQNSKHFERIQKLLRENPHLYTTEVTPTRSSNWIYYLIMHDPMAHPDYRDQGYIGETRNRLTTKWKNHQDSALEAIRKNADTPSCTSLVDCNFALLNINLHLRGENVSDYAAIIALGSLPPSEKVPGTEVSLREAIEGQLILENFVTRDGMQICVVDMKCGMNDEHCVSKVNLRKIKLLHSRKEEFSVMIQKCWSNLAGKSLSYESKMDLLIKSWPKLT